MARGTITLDDCCDDPRINTLADTLCIRCKAPIDIGHYVSEVRSMLTRKQAFSLVLLMYHEACYTDLVDRL